MLGLILLLLCALAVWLSATLCAKRALRRNEGVEGAAAPLDIEAPVAPLPVETGVFVRQPDGQVAVACAVKAAAAAIKSVEQWP
ncbi:hypothetical protein WJX72_004759 [[Myrmecia] bisecta]|uniref:Uncharacterized protein n=1 Tax=[Myrmecia] bisecta TaxID=41462 RepID=A0AAW1P5U5_9CHLO